MSASQSSTAEYDRHEKEFWSRRGSLLTALLVLIPGMAVLAAAVAHPFGESIPAFIFGFGSGFVLWGIIATYMK